MKKFSELKFKKPDINKIENEINDLISKFKNAQTFNEQDKALIDYFKYCDHLETNFTIGNINYTLDTLNPVNQKNMDIINNTMPIISSFTNKFDKELVNAKFRKELEEKWGTHLFNMTENSLKCFDEKIIPELTRLNELDSEYTKIIASANIEFNGETYNLIQLGKFTQDKDRNIRKEASILQAKFFEEHDEEIGKIYDEMVKTRTIMAQKLGYKNFVELGYRMLNRTDYNDNDVKNYRDQIYNDLVPFTNKLFKRQAKRLGIKNPQYYDYNLKFNTGNATPVGDKDVLVNKAKQMYHELSKETDTFFNFMCDYELLDLESRKGKAGGGYMTYLPDYKAPFIFSNFNGTSGDVDVLTHEFGHAFQGYMSRNNKCPIYRQPTLEACEIHSMSMEFITYPWMNLFFEENEEKYRYSHLEDAITFIPYGVTIDEFQHWVYENYNASHEERCQKFREIEKKYLPHKKYKDTPIFEKGRWWLKQSHVFGAPFYYIDYTLAQVCAFQFFIENEKNHTKCWNKYVKFCKLGGKYPFTELLSVGHLKNPFVEGTVKKIISPLKKYLNSIDDMSL